LLRQFRSWLKLNPFTSGKFICACLFLLVYPVQTVYADQASNNQSANSQTDNEQQPNDQRLFKAAFIFHFAKLTSWPEKTWNNTLAPLNICTKGTDQLASDLKRLSGKIIKGRPVSIRSLKNVRSINDCHVLYIATSEKKRYQKIIRQIRNQPVLTISEIKHFTQTGGVIGLFREKGQTRFMIDLDNVRNTGLVLSSRLLNIAVVVGDKELP